VILEIAHRSCAAGSVMRIAQVHAKEMLRVKSLSSARRRRWQRWSEIQPTPFRQVYDFILRAVRGVKATADAIFEDYLGGTIRRTIVDFAVLGERGSSRQAQQRASSTGMGRSRESMRGGVGVGDEAFTAGA
jgi:hypothetical protein